MKKKECFSTFNHCNISNSCPTPPLRHFKRYLIFNTFYSSILRLLIMQIIDTSSKFKVPSWKIKKWSPRMELHRLRASQVSVAQPLQIIYHWYLAMSNSIFLVALIVYAFLCVIFLFCSFLAFSHFSLYSSAFSGLCHLAYRLFRYPYTDFR